MDFIVEQIEMPFIFMGTFSGIRDPNCSQDDSYTSLRNYRGKKCWFWLHLYFCFLFSCLPSFTSSNSRHVGISRGLLLSSSQKKEWKRRRGRSWVLAASSLDYASRCMWWSPKESSWPPRCADSPDSLAERTGLLLGMRLSLWTTCTSSSSMVFRSF